MGMIPRATKALLWGSGSLVAVATSGQVSAQSVEELRDMSITALADLDVSSVTKSPGALSDAPGSIYVITHDDIVRSGTLTLPGILRLAPNLQVARNRDNGVVITARGLSGNPDAQNFANKLLVLIDGRSVYSPLFSGVYWDMQDVLPEDVDRIEVISGPGATLWGGNAVNGVINIITRRTGATQGLYATGVAGNRTYDAGLRYGGRIGETVSYRLFGKLHRNLNSSDTANDGSRRIEGGFRVDWSPAPTDDIMVQGNAYDGEQSRGLSPDETYFGQHLLARWNHGGASDSALQVQSYYDRTGRETKGEGKFTIETFDVDVEHSFALGSAHKVVWGGGARISHYDIAASGNLQFIPNTRTLFMGNIYVQDSITIAPSLTGIVGLKLEHDPFSGAVLLPNARLAWKPTEKSLLWASVSRAIRAPSPFDRDVAETLGGSLFLTGSPEFRSEKLTAYEAGTRLILSEQASLSVSAFYNVYDDLRSIEFAATGILPLRWGNGIEGDTYGFDAWADVRLADWWRIKPGYSLLIQKFRFKDGASGLLGVSQVGNDPRHRASVRSSMDIGSRINLDADLRYVSALPSPYVPDYVEMGARIGWQVNERAELSVSGFNLLHKRHQELPSNQANPVGRSVFVALKWHI